MKENKTVDAFIAKHEKWEKALTLLRRTILSTGLEESIKWSVPVYSWSGKNIVGVGAFKHHFGLWFFQGVLLEDKEQKLVNVQAGKTQAMRQWRFTAMEEIDVKLLKKYIKEAVANQKAGREIKAAKPTKTRNFKIPDLLTDAFGKNRKVAEAFENLSVAKQREYVYYIVEAKREATKIRRVEKIVPMILAGSGLNDKYR